MRHDPTPSHAPETERPACAPTGAGRSPLPAPLAPHQDPRGPLFRFDPGWLFLIAGAALIAATVLIPVNDQLASAQWQRDRAIAVERYRAKRLENYSAYLDAVERQDRTVVLWLAATQLNLAPADKMTMLEPGDLALPKADVFANLEPTFQDVPVRVKPQSLLQTWTTSERHRLWLIAAGALCVLIGLLPPSRRA